MREYLNNRQTGAKGEGMAADYLQARGVRIAARNFRSRYGEIDLIGYHKGYLVFFEVKYRRNRDKGLPEEAVSFYKQKRICRVADYYRRVKRVPPDTGIRYDVVAVEEREIRWYENAFSHIS